MLKRAKPAVVILDLLLLMALHGDQAIDLALQAADGKEQFVVVRRSHTATSISSIVLGLDE